MNLSDFENNENRNNEMDKMVELSFTKGPQVDTVANAHGRFGYSKSNPVPVEDQQGQMDYLARLRCPCNEFFAFHRIGNFGCGPDGHTIDGYEIICGKHKHKFILYMDMYHKGQSRLLPEGMSQGEPEGVGMPFHVKNFPDGLAGAFKTEEWMHEEQDGMILRTMRSTEPAVCMHCRHKQDFVVYLAVNANLDPELREDLLNYTFSVLTCAQCGKETKIDYSFFYYDMTSKCWLWYIAEGDDDQVPFIEEAQSRLGMDTRDIYQDCHCRIVRYPLELNEKIRLFEDGLDDRVMEIFKFFALMKNDELSGENAKSLYYVESCDEALQFLAVDNKGAGMVQLHPEGYKDIASRFADRLPDMNSLLGQYLEIDPNYVLNCLKGITEEKKKQSEQSGGMFSRFTSWFKRN